jgi:hypothetical protein
MKTPPTKPRSPRGGPGRKRDSDPENQATAAEFEREGLGVAPKE